MMHKSYLLVSYLDIDREAMHIWIRAAVWDLTCANSQFSDRQRLALICKS